VIGLATDLQETARGLEFRGKLARKVQAALDAGELLNLGAMKTFSIGYSVACPQKAITWNVGCVF
jgi:phage head maturation protease